MMRLIKHPAAGWLIGRPDVVQNEHAAHRLILPDGNTLHPLEVYQSDFAADDVDGARMWALEQLNIWRGEQREAIGLTDSKFQELAYTGKALECQRWMADQVSAFGLHGEAAARGLSDAEMAALVLAQWAAWQAASDGIEAAYVSTVASISGAADVALIAALLDNLCS